MQRIEVRVSASSGGHELHIAEVYLVNNKLIVISKITTPNGAATSSFTFPGQIITVKTGSEKPLEVVNYLLNNKRNKEIFTYPGFIQLSSINDIKDLISKGKLIYKPRYDHLNPLRLNYFDKPLSNNTQIRALPIEPTSSISQAINTKANANILNIFTVVDDEEIAILFETITEDQSRIYKDISHFMSVLSPQTKDDFTLNNDLLMMTDDTLHFNANYLGNKTGFSSIATQFILPRSKPESVLRFLILMEGYLLESRYKKDEYDEPYSHFQLSQQSILSCFDDLIISHSGRAYPRGNIENSMRISMEEFINTPAACREPELMIRQLFTSIINDDTAAYKQLRDYMKRFYSEFGFNAIQDAGKALWLMYHLSTIYSTRGLDATKIDPMIHELEDLIIKHNYLDLILPFIENFNKIAIAKLIDYASFYGDPFDPERDSAEFDLLRDAEFHLREDGRLSVNLRDNAAYQKNYSEGSPKHAKCETALRHLAKMLRINYAQETDFSKELIFTPESTSLLITFGVHVNVGNLRTKAHKKYPAINPYKPATTQASEYSIPAFAILQRAGINSESAYKLLAANKACEDILPIMQKAGLFAKDTVMNKSLFGELINRLQFLQNNPGVDSVSDLIRLYNLLGGHGNDCWLTHKVNKIILQGLVYSRKVARMVLLIEKLPPLDAHIITKLFSTPSAPLIFLELWEMAAKWGNPKESLLKLLKSNISMDDVNNCQRELSYPTRSWYTREIFNLVLDHIDQCKYVIKGFDTLHKYDLFDSHRECFLKNPAIEEIFSILEEIRSLTPENIILSMENATFCAATIATRYCSRLSLIYPGEEKRLLKLLIAHENMIPIINQLCLGRDKFGSENNPDFTPVYADLKLLLASTGVPFHVDFDPVRKSKTDYFKLFTSRKFEDCVKNLGEKYKINTNPSSQESKQVVSRLV